MSDFKESLIGPIAPVMLLADHFKPLRDTIKLKATGIEKKHRKPYFLAGDMLDW